ERGLEKRDDGRSLVHGNRRRTTPLVYCVIVQTAGPVELISRQPSPHELPANSLSEPSQEISELPEGLHRPSGLDRFLEGERRPPGPERTGVLSPREPLERDAFVSQPLVERRRRENGQRAQRP